MKALELLKEKLAKLCMSFDGVWISEEKLNETAKELEKIFKENSEDRLKELESLTTTQQTTQIKFKVGDCVVHTGEGYWKPKPGEWCWVFDKKTDIPALRKFVCIDNKAKTDWEKGITVSFPYKVERQDGSGTLSYRYIEPFIGTLPSTIKLY